MKKWIGNLIIFVFVLCPFLSVQAETPVDPSDIEVYIDGELEELDQAPMFVEQQLFLPMKEIYEAFGAKVDWNQEDRFVAASNEEMEIKVDLGSLTITLDSGNEQMRFSDEQSDDASLNTARIVDGRIWIPLQVVKKSLNVSATYSEELNYILFDTKTEPTHEQMDEQQGLFAEGQEIADFLSFLIEETTEDRLVMSNTTNQILVRHAVYFFANNRKPTSLDPYAEEMNISDWITPSNQNKIVKTGPLYVKKVEEKQLTSNTKLFVIEGHLGTKEMEEQSNVLLYYFGEVEPLQNKLINFTGIKVGQYDSGKDEETDDEQHVFVVVAGNVFMEEEQPSPDSVHMQETSSDQEQSEVTESDQKEAVNTDHLTNDNIENESEIQFDQAEQ